MRWQWQLIYLPVDGVDEVVTLARRTQEQGLGSEETVNWELAGPAGLAIAKVGAKHSVASSEPRGEILEKAKINVNEQPQQGKTY